MLFHARQFSGLQLDHKVNRGIGVVLLVVLDDLWSLRVGPIEHWLNHLLLVHLGPHLDWQLGDFDGVLVAILDNVDHAARFKSVVFEGNNLPFEAFVPWNLL